MKKSYPVSQSLTFIACRFALVFALCVIGGMEAQAQLPTNIDFSLGNFTNWLCYTGTATPGTAATGPNFTGATLSGPVTNRHTLIDTTTDPYGSFPGLAPGGGTYSLKIGNNSVGAQAERVRYYVHVPAGTTKFSIQYQFAVVFEDPGHLPSEQPSFKVIAYDSATGAIIPSANNLFVAGPSLPGFLTSPINAGVLYRGWTPCTINLSGKGGQTVIVEVTSSDCTPAGHFGYGYFDAVATTNYLAPTVVSCNLASNTIKLQAPPGYKYYQWYNQNFSTALNSATDTSSTITLPIPATPQYYNVILVPYFAGGAPDTVRTNLINGFTISASPSSMCVSPGSSTQLLTTVSGGIGSYSYQWSGATTLDSFTIANPIASPLAPSAYVVKVTDTNGCFRTDTVVLSMGSFQVNAGPDTTTCLGNSINLNASVSPASSAYTFSWSPASNLSGTSTLYPAFTPSAIGTQQYILTVDSAGCSLYDTINVRTLTDSFAVQDTTVCAGVNVIPFVSGDSSFTYTWTPATRLTFASPSYPGSDQRPVFAADTTTIFTITAAYPGCPNIVKQLTVSVEPLPIVSLGADTVYKGASTPIGISTTVAPGWFSNYSYTWTSNSFIDSPSNASINFSGATDTTLYVTVTTPAGCTGSDAVHVIVSGQLTMSVPNAFVPGSSANGRFRIVRIDPDYTMRSFRVYNRWGKKVFESHNIAEGWDGNANGSAQPMGVYVYVLEATSVTGKTVVQKGSVTLIR